MEPWTLEDIAELLGLLRDIKSLLWVFVSIWLVWFGWHIFPEFWLGKRQHLGDQGG